MNRFTSLKLFLMTLVILLCFSLSAKQVGQNAAVTVARSLLNQKFDISQVKENQLTLAYTETIANPKSLRSFDCYYVFNVGKDQGFIIISGDDIARPILGYSTQGTFDVNNLPPNFEVWMNNIAEAISQGAQKRIPTDARIAGEWNAYLTGNTDYFSQKDDTRAVASLITTVWNQGDPFNLFCPVYNGTICITGCVATAMAQLMNYYQHPAMGIGSSPEYLTETNGIRVPSVSFNVAYDWDNMIDNYNYGVGTQAQKEAVATLMYHCGVSVYMDYSPTSSGAYYSKVVPALINYFDYDKGIRQEHKSYYSDHEWIVLLKQQIDANKPIYYTGNNIEGGGHAFICDGYDGNHFHFNWGWGGYQDGYYSVDPMPGILFPLYNMIFTDIKPDAGGQYVYQIGLRDEIDLTSTANSVSPLETFTATAAFYNRGFIDFPANGQYGIGLFDTGNNLIAVLDSLTINQVLKSGYYWEDPFSFNCQIPATIPAGDYTIRAITKATELNGWEIARGASIDVLPLTVIVNPYTVTFDAGNGICTTPSLEEVSGGSGVTLPIASPSNNCIAVGYEFAGWATTSITETTTAPTLYAAGTLYYPTEDCTLYAVYMKTGVNTNTYILINNISNLEIGQKYVVTSGTSGAVKAMVSRGSSTSTNNQGATEETVSSSQIILSDTSSATPFILEKDSNNDWTFSDGTYYLTATNTTSSNYLRTTSSLDAYSGFSISFNADAAVVTCTGKTSRNIMRYNSSSNLFSCYTSGQNDIYLFKNTPGSTYNSNPDCTVTPVLTVSEENLDFESITIGQTSEPQTVAVSGADLTGNITYVKGGADAAAFTVTETSWNAATGGTLSVTFAPTEARAYSATLTISSAGAEDKTVTLSGTGIAPATPTLTVEPISLIFNDVTTGTTSEPQTVTVSGTDLTGNITYVKGGADAAAFTIDAVSFDAEIGGTLSVTFEPTEARAYSATITISSEGAEDKVVTLSGTGITASTTELIAKWSGYTPESSSGAIFLANGGSVANVGIATLTRDAAGTGYAVNTDGVAASAGWNGATTVEKYWITTFSTIGFTDLTFTSKQRGSNTGPKDFKVQYKVGESGTWADVDNGVIIVANDNYTTGVKENIALPSAMNNQEEVFLRWLCTSTTSINNSTVAAAGVNRLDVTVSGQPTTPTPTITANPMTLDFGNIITSTTSPAETVTISGTNLTGNITYVKGGADAAAFTIDAASFDAEIGGTLSVTFAPTEAKTYNATITISSEGAEDKVVTLSGTGIAPATPTLTVEPISLTFTDVTTGTTSEPQTVTVSGTDLTGAITYVKGGADAAAFTVTETSWNAATGGTLSVTFAPTEARAYSATITISSEGAEDKVVALSGTGILAAPVATAATDITTSGFTANWNAVQGVEEYELNVYTKIQVSELVANGGFELGSLSNWSGDNLGFYTIETETPHTGDNYVSRSSASGTGVARLEQVVSVEIGKTYIMSFWYNNYAASSLNGLKNYTIQGISGTNYIDAEPLKLPAASSWTKYEKEFTATTSSVKISLRSYEPCDIDDFSIMEKGTSTSITGAPFTVSGTSYPVTGLAPETTYYYTVKAKAGSQISDASNEISVTTLPIFVGEQILLTWDAFANATKSAELSATAGEEFLIDWGDGTTNTYTGTGDYWIYSHAYTSAGLYSVSANTKTTNGHFLALNCNVMALTALDVSEAKELTALSCYVNDLTALDVTQNIALTALACNFNQITALDVTQNRALTFLNCSGNPLTALNVSQNTVLNNLYCNNNQLATLDITSNTALTDLDCSGNQLIALNVSQNTALTKLNCSGNQLSALDVSQNRVLNNLYCNNNNLKFSTLPSPLPAYSWYTYAPQDTIDGGIVAGVIDLSSEYSIQENITVYRWYEVNGDMETEIPSANYTDHGNGTFTFGAAFDGKILRCKMTNATFPYFTASAPLVYEVTIEAPVQYIITATAGENGTIDPKGEITVTEGDNQTFTFTPLACHQIDQVLINGVNNAEAVTNGTYTFTNVTDDQTIAVSFKRISYTITATADANGTITPSGTVSVDCGSDKTFTFTPSACHQIDQVLINGVNNTEAVTNGTYTFTNVTDDQTIAVSFKLISYTITATAGEGGTIMPSGAVSVDCGSDKTFTFTPSACHQIDQVLINGVNNTEAVTNGTYTFTNVTEDQTIAVSFKLISYTITATAGEGGTIMPSGTVLVDCGSDKTFTFTPSACHQIDQVLINGVNNAEAVSNGTYTFTNVTDDQTIAVSFKLISYTITATAGEGGTIMPSGTVLVDCGSDKTFTFTPSACHQIDQVLINGENNAEAVANGTYTFTNVTEDQTIAVSFKRISYTITATAGEGGTIMPSGTVLVDCGSDKTFTFTPLACHQIDQVLINGENNAEAVTNGTYTFTNVTDDQTIAVSFKRISYTITATADANGTITPSGTVLVDCGSDKTFTFTPSACYQIDQVLINGVNNTEAVTNGTYTFTNVTEDQTIAVSFKRISYTITATADANGTITPSGTVLVDCGSDKTFTFTPSACHQIDQVLINGVNNAEAVANGNYTFTNVTDDQTIAVSFKLISYTITATADANGTITPSGTVLVDCGSNKTFTFTPSACHQIDQVLINGVNNTEAVTNGTYTFTNVTDDQTIAVSFKRISYTITATADANGTITPSGTVSVDCGSDKTFTFTPSACHQIDQVLINGVNNAEAVSNGTYTFTNVTDDQTIAVSFKRISYTITATADANGTITPSGTVLVDCGSDKTFTFTPSACYQIDQVLINGVNNTEAVTNGTYTFTNVTEDQTIAVSFKRISYTITATADANGTITPSGTVSVDCGSDKTFTFTPSACYQIDQVLINGVNNAEAVSNGTYTFTNVTEDQTIAVSFKLISYTITATADANGMITPSGTVSVDCGSDKTFTFTPSACHQIDQVLINGVNNAEAVTNGTYTFTNVTDDQTIAVSFKLISYTITATAGEGGTIMPSGTVSVDCGSDKTFTFTPSACHQIDKVLINGVNNAEAVSNGTYTFTNVTDDQTIAVSFKLISYTITATADANGMIAPSGTVLVDCGSDKTFTFTPSACHQIDQVLINGVNNAEAVTNGTYTFTNVTDDQTIAVSFKLISYTITATAGEGGTIMPSGLVLVDCGSDKTFTFTPSACHQIDQVLINGVNNAEAVANGNYTFTNVTDDQTIAVSFKLISYTITATAGEGGTIMPSGTVSVDCGSDKTFTFTPSACHQIDQVLINGVNNAEAVTNGNYTFTNVTDDQTIAVSFKLISYTITATADANGTITPSGTVSVDCGSDKTFTFTPSACHQIDQVLINGVNNAEAVANGTYTFTNVTDDQTIAVSFKRISYTITATADANGTITPSGTVLVDCGSDKTFTFTPSACHQIDQVLINGVNNAEAVTNGNYTFTNVTDDQTIAVSFKLISYTITATADANGTITPSGTVSVDCGSDKTFTFTADNGYEVYQLLIDEVNVSDSIAGGSYTFVDVMEDHTIEVTFKPIPPATYIITATAGENGTIDPEGEITVTEGDYQTFTFIADNGYEVDQLLIDEVNVPDSIAGGSYTFVDVMEDHTIEVTFKPIPPATYIITATAGENGSIDPEGEITVTEGDNQTFTFTANNGYEVYQLLIDEVNVPDSMAGGSYTFVGVTEDHTIEVTFKPIPVTQYTIAATAGSNGTITPNGAILVDEGDHQRFTFIANNGYEVDQLLIDEVNVPDSIAGGSYTFVDVTEDHTIEVTFKSIPPTTYTISASAGENGSIDPEGEITVTEGDNQNFTFAANNGYEVDQLLIDGTNVSDSIAGGSYTFVGVTENHSIEVTFKPIPLATYIITATAGENGSIDPEGEITVIEGDHQTFTFTASNGYEVDQLLIDEVNVSDSIAGGSYTFVDVTEDHTIEVTFKMMVPQGEQMLFTWNATAGSEKSFELRATDGEAFVVDWGDGESEVYTGKGNSNTLLSHTYNSTASYSVSVSASTTDGHVTYLYCPYNELTALDVSHNTKLTYLYCNNNQLTALDVSQNSALEYLRCNNNELTALDVSQNSALEYLRCNSNQLTALDVSVATALTDLYCQNNQLTALDVSQKTVLEYLFCQENQLTALNVNGATALIYLYCYNNQLTALDVSTNTALVDLYCESNQFTALNLSQNTTLTNLRCHHNQLIALDVSTNTALSTLWCSSNQLTALDVSTNTALIILYCENNQLTALDVSTHTALRYLLCNHNELTALDVSGATALTYLDCDNNLLTALDVSQNSALEYLRCYNNQLKFSALPLQQNNWREYGYAPQDTIDGGIAPGFVDLSSEYSIQENITVYSWYEVNGDMETAIPSANYTDHGNGTFTFGAAFDGKILRCKMTNATFPDFTASAPLVYEVTIEAPVQYIITATAGENGSIDPEGEITVTEGDNQTFTFTANNGYEVYQLLIDEVNVPDSIAGGSYTFVGVTENHSIEVTFKPIPPATYIISASAGENGSIDPEGEITVTEGDNQTFTFIANNGYEVDELLIDEVNVPDSIAGGSYTFVDVTEDHTIEVTFKPIPPTTYTISASAGENGSIDPEGEITVTEGDNQTFTFTANNGYEVYQLLIDEVNVPDSMAGGSYTFVDVTEDHSIEVTFKLIPPATYIITATAGENGTIDPEGEITVTEGDHQTFTFTADNGYEVDELLIDEVNVPDSIAGGSYTFVDVTEDHTIEVTFKPIPPATYIITATAGENGSIDPEGAITVTEGDNQTFTFTANNGYEVDELLIDEVNVPDSIAGGSYTFVDVTEDHSIEVTFKPIPPATYTISASAGENGSIDPEGEITVTEGDNQTFTFTADNGYEVYQLLIDEVNVPDSIAGGSYTFVGVTEDHTIEVTFKPIPPATYTITATAGENGSIDPEGEITVIEGDHQTFTFTANNGYEVDELLIDNVNIADSIAGGSYTFVDVTEDHSIEVTFKPIPPATYTITATAGANGTISPNGNILVNVGDNQNFTFIANNGYEVYQLLVDEVNVPDSIAGGSYTFENVTEDHTIAVTFKVIAVGEQMLFTWNADANNANSEKSFTLRATDGEAFVVDWGDGTTNTYTGNGNTNISLLHTYASPASYFVSVSASTTDGHVAYLRCDNNQLTALDVSGATALTDLNCSGNQLIALDVSQNSALTYLYCDNNQLTALDVSTNTALRALRCYNNQLTALGVSTNTALTALNCSGNKLTALDVSTNTALTDLECSNNQLTALDVSQNSALEYLRCISNQLIALDLNQNSALIELWCYNNQLTALDVSGATALTDLECDNNQLTALDVSGATALTDLDCYNNQLTVLDISTNTALRSLNCSGNLLTALYVSTNTALSRLYCHNNQLTALYISTNTALSTLWCNNNQLKFSALPLPQYTYYNYVPQDTINGGIAPGFVDLSSEYNIGGNITVYTWYELNGTTEAEISSGYTDHGNGTFTFGAAFDGKILRCKMTNATFPDFTASAPLVYEVTIEAPVQYTITATAGSNGTITPNGAILVDEGDHQTFTFIADNGYEVDELLVDNVNIADSIAGGSYTFVDVTEDHTIEVTFKVVPVSNIELLGCPENGLLANGATCQLRAAVFPGNALNKTVVWRSTNPNTAIVDANGLVTARSTGVTYIIAKAQEGDAADTCHIRVVQPVSGIVLTPAQATLLLGEEKQLMAKILPENATIMDIIWSSSDETAVTVDAHGKITGIAVGEGVITATTVDGGFEAMCQVTVVNAHAPATGVTVTPTTLAIGRGETYQLSAEVKPANASQMVTWSSNNPVVATVAADGTVTALAAGKATITAKTDNNYKATCAVTVTIPIDSIVVTPDEWILPLKGAKALKATVYPSDASNKTIKWSSSNTTIATVSSTGTVTAKNTNGVVEIYATNTASGISGVCAITVGTGIPAAPPMDISEENTTNHIVLYPNPTTGKVTIKSTSLVGRPGGAIKVFDMTGRLVLEMNHVDDNEVILDLSGYAAGVYFINVDGKTMKVVKK